MGGLEYVCPRKTSLKNRYKEEQFFVLRMFLDMTLRFLTALHCCHSCFLSDAHDTNRARNRTRRQDVTMSL